MERQPASATVVHMPMDTCSQKHRSKPPDTQLHTLYIHDTRQVGILMISSLREESKIRLTILHSSENLCDVTEEHEKELPTAIYIPDSS